MSVKFSNHASTTLSSAINSTQTTINVTSVSSFPTLGSGDYFYLTIGDGTGSGSEIVKVTGVYPGGSVLVVRAQEGTTAQSHTSGTAAAIRITAQGLVDLGAVNSLSQGGSWAGSNMPGSRYAGLAAGGGNIVFLRDNPGLDSMSILTDGNFYSAENKGFYSLVGDNYNARTGFTGNSSGHFLISHYEKFPSIFVPYDGRNRDFSKHFCTFSW